MTNDGKPTKTVHHGSGDRGVGRVSTGSGSGGGDGLNDEAAVDLSSNPGNGRRRWNRNQNTEVADRSDRPAVSRDGNLIVRTQHVSGQGTESGDGKLVIPPVNDGRRRAPTGDVQTVDENLDFRRPKYLQFGEGAKEPIKLDSKKSVQDLLKDPNLEGRFVASDKAADPNDPERQGDKLKSGETPKIKVVYEDETGNKDAPKPDFIVKKDGTIEVVNNPERNPDRDIVIQVERDKGQTGAPPEEQQKAVDELTKYMAERVAQNPDYFKLSGGKVEVEDKQNLVSDQTEKSIPNNIGQNAPPVPEDVQRISDEMNRIRGSGGSGNFGRGRINDATGRREVPAQADEVPPVQAMKETLAAMFKPDEKEPYKTVRRDNDGYRVGRYGMSGRNAGNWLGMLLAMDPELAAILGDPPDYSKLQEYLKKHPDKAKGIQAKMAAAMKQGMQQMGENGKVPKEFAQKFDDPEFAKGFSDFIGKMGDPNTPQEEIKAGMDKFMPKELQETMNQQMVEHYAKQIVGDKNPDHMTPEDAGKIGLAMLLGRVPTQEDLSNPNYKKYQDATQNFYTLARAGQFGPGDINVSEHNQKLVAAAKGNVGERLWAQSPWASVCENGNLGCAASVSMVLKEMGVRVQGSAGVVELARQLREAGYEQIPITNMNQYRPGDIVYGAKGSGGGGSGHIGIIGEVINGQVWQYDNSSASGQWSHRTVQSGGSFVPGQRFGNGQLFVLRRREA